MTQRNKLSHKQIVNRTSSTVVLSCLFLVTQQTTIAYDNKYFFNNRIIANSNHFKAPSSILLIAKSNASDDAIAPSLDPGESHDNAANTPFILRGKAEVNQHLGNNLLAWQAAQIYKQGVGALSANRFALATQYFKLAGDRFAAAGDNEKFLAESRYAEAQSRRLLGQKQLAVPLYQEAISLFKQYDPLSPYLQAAMDNLKMLTPPPLQARVAKTNFQLKALTEISGIQAVDRNITMKGRVTDSDIPHALRAEKASATSNVTEGHIKKTVLQAFIKMTCLETAELGSTYYNAVDRYLPLRADGKNVAVAASSGFTAPIINIKINGRYYNVGIDLPDLSSSRRTVYLVTDGKNILAIDPATYDVWKLYIKGKGNSAEFDWKKLTHLKDVPHRITP